MNNILSSISNFFGSKEKVNSSDNKKTANQEASGNLEPKSEVADSAIPIATTGQEGTKPGTSEGKASQKESIDHLGKSENKSLNGLNNKRKRIK